MNVAGWKDFCERDAYQNCNTSYNWKFGFEMDWTD